MTDTNDIVKTLKRYSCQEHDNPEKYYAGCIACEVWLDISNAIDLIEQLQDEVRDLEYMENGASKKYQQRIEELEKLLTVCGVDPEDLEDNHD